MESIDNLSNRQQMILLLLTSSEHELTSEQIAKSIGVSSRTIKTDMHHVDSVLQDNGARLISRRNYGYSIEVIKDVDFIRIRELLRSKSAHINLANSNEGARVLFLSRKLISADRYITMNELCNDLFLSVSSLYPLLVKTYEYCRSFHLNVMTNQKGIRVTGSECMLRIAMAELVELNSEDQEVKVENFEKWAGCNYTERQAIRHVFLQVLRQSGYSVRDSIAHRVAMYLVIARNRYKANRKIRIDDNTIKEVMQSETYFVSENIYRELNHRFNGFSLNRNEIVFLAILILSNLDISLKRDYLKTAPYMNRIVHKTVDTIFRFFQKKQLPDFSSVPFSKQMLEEIVLSMAAAKKYGLDGYQHFDFTYVRVYQKSPLCVFLAMETAESISKSLNSIISSGDMTILSCYYEALLIEIEYDIKKLRILTTHSIGTEFARIQSEKLLMYFPKLIESITPVELYEIRGLDTKDYDAVLTENVVPGKKEKGLFGYNYDLPATTIQMVQNGRDFGEIYNDVLVLAYQIAKWIPSFENIHVYQNIVLAKKDSELLLFLANRYAKNDYSKENLFMCMNDQMERREQFHSDTIILFGNPVDCKNACLDLYIAKRLKGKLNFRLKYLIFVAFGYKTPLLKIKTIETILTNFGRDSATIDAFAKDPVETMKLLVTDSLRIN